jgi:ribosomal protein S18 acetylase RimI-like enzyme
MLTVAVEEAARAAGFRVLNLDVRETLGAAIQLYHSLGYQHFGTHPHYALVDGQYVQGLYFWKDLQTEPEVSA